MSDMALDYVPRKITVSEYHRMAEVGILAADERVELLDGTLVTRSPIGRPHRMVHALIVEYLNLALGERAIVQGMSSVQLGEYSEPQPDILVLPRKLDEFVKREPDPTEVYAVIEIADSSLRKDIGIKRRLYGDFQVADYFVVDVQARVLLRFTAPFDTWDAQPERLGVDDTFRLRSLPEIELAAKRFLPPLPKADAD
jgi:Uma2 family endonuclease